MTKRLTISNRWRNWAEEEPWWAYSALVSMALSFVGLIFHLGILTGWWRGYFLIQMIVCAVICEAILIIRKQLWWATYWGICVIVMVAVWEIASYFFGGI